MSFCRLMVSFMSIIFVSVICHIVNWFAQNSIGKIFKSVFWIIKQAISRLFFSFTFVALFPSTLPSLLCCCHSNSMTIAIIAFGLLMELESTVYPDPEIIVLVLLMYFRRAKETIFFFHPRSLITNSFQ